MRSPRRRRPRRRERFVPPDIDLAELAARVKYVGSPEHKDAVTSVGVPRRRGDASICPREYNELQLATGWLRSAIRDGSTGGPWEGDFPRYAWHKEAATVFEARLVNRGDGSYKGYPLNDDEWPRHMVDSR